MGGFAIPEATRGAIIVAAGMGGCPVHEAAKAAVQANAPEPLVARVSERDSTAECAQCPFCETAIELIREFRKTGGMPAGAWARLQELSR